MNACFTEQISCLMCWHTEQSRVLTYGAVKRIRFAEVRWCVLQAGFYQDTNRADLFGAESDDEEGAIFAEVSDLLDLLFCCLRLMRDTELEVGEASGHTFCLWPESIDTVMQMIANHGWCPSLLDWAWVCSCHTYVFLACDAHPVWVPILNVSDTSQQQIHLTVYNLQKSDSSAKQDVKRNSQFVAQS